MSASKEKKWKIASRKRILKTRILDVYRESVKLPNGSKIDDYTIVKMHNYVKLVVTDSVGKVLIIREYRHAIRQYIWELCAGFIDEGESPIEAAKRELEEETGYTAGNFKVIGKIYDAPSTTPHVGYVVRVTNVSGRKTQKLEDTESIVDVRFVSRKQAQEMVLKNKFVSSSVLAAFALSGLMKS